MLFLQLFCSVNHETPAAFCFCSNQFYLFKTMEPPSSQVTVPPLDPAKQRLELFHKAFIRTVYILKFFEIMHAWFFSVFLFCFFNDITKDTVPAAFCLILFWITMGNLAVAASPRRWTGLALVERRKEKKEYATHLFNLFLARIILWLITLVFMTTIFVLLYSSVKPNFELIFATCISSVYHFTAICGKRYDI